MKDSKKNRKKIAQFLYDFDDMFQIQNFEKKIVYKKENNDKFTIAEICYESEYQRATIYIYPIFFTYQYNEQRKILIHELCHSITLNSKKLSFYLLDGKLVTEKQIRDENEEMTSKIENIIDLLLSGRYSEKCKKYKQYAT